MSALNTHVDSAIIGSSPLMLLQALRIAADGRTCVVIDQAQNFGGMWRVASSPDGTTIEAVCHLLEDFEGVYELISKNIDCCFEPLVPPPETLKASGKREHYMSRYTILRDLAFDVARLLYNTLRSLFFGAEHKSTFSIIRSKKRILDFVFFTQRHVLFANTIQQPVGGFGRLIPAFEVAMKQRKIDFVDDTVIAAKLQGGKWELKTESGKSIVAQNVFCSAAAALAKCGPAEFTKTTPPTKTVTNILISVEPQFIRRQISYVRLAAYKKFSRIHRLPFFAQNLKLERYMLQLISEVQPTNEEALEAARVLFAELDLVSDVGQLQLAAATKQSVNDYRSHVELPDGELARNFHVLYSTGNLASGIAHWMRLAKRPHSTN